MIHEKETVLPDDYPVHVGYCYVVVFEDGEDKAISSDITGTARYLRADLAKLHKKPVKEIRRCNMLARKLF